MTPAGSGLAGLCLAGLCPAAGAKPTVVLAPERTAMNKGSDHLRTTAFRVGCEGLLPFGAGFLGEGFVRAGLRGIAAGVAGLSVAMSAACGTSRSVDHPARATAEPTTAARLYSRILTDRELPQGFYSDPNNEMPTVAPSPVPPSSEPCQQLGLFTGLSIFANVAPPAASAWTSIGQPQTDHSGRPTWSGSEWLDYYPAGGAHHVLEMARALIHRCPHDTVSEPRVNGTFAIAAGPRLGDESLRIEARATYPDADGQFGRPQVELDLIAIRSGHVLILVECDGWPLSFRDPLTEIAGEAYRVYTRVHS